MAAPIGRIDPKTIAEILGDDDIMAVAHTSPASTIADSDIKINKDRSPFDAILGKAVDSLAKVSKAENETNLLINSYIQGNADISEVMIANSKMNILMQLAVTAITSAVNTFKEITQMQV